MTVVTGQGQSKPRVALLGEFSAGKSTLANVLLGASHSPVRVTATQMPPLWYHAGEGPLVRVLADGREDILGEYLGENVPIEDTQAVRIPTSAPLLDRFDLLDMPGSSDPNMAAGLWDALLPMADIVIWCTPATQAWRQSEAALWEAVPEKLHQRSLLLLTRIDKVDKAADRVRVLSRVRRETEGLFRHVLPAALLRVGAAPEDCDASGMADVIEALDDLLDHPTAPVPTSEPKGAQISDGGDEALDMPRIVPRRVTHVATPDAAARRRRATASDTLL